MIDTRSTAATRARYDRIAPFYDVMQRLNERRFAPHRAALWGRVQGPRVLEVVPDPILGLRELRRVLVPGGHLLLMEHVLSTRPVLRRMMQLLNPMVRPMMGANIDRETVENVRRAGFAELQVKDLGPLDIVKGIDALAPEPGFAIA